MSRILDVSLIGLVWVVARVPLLVYRYPPQVQFDSFSHRPFWIAVFNPHHPPLYGTFLALVPPVAVIVLQHLMVYVSAVCLYEIVRRSANRFGGLVSAAFVVTYGDFVLYGHTFMSETSFNFFLALHLLTLWYAIERKSPAWYFLSGLCIGTGALTRASLQYQAVLVAAVLLPFSARPLRRLKAYGRSMAALIGGFLVICLPWVAATWLVYGEWVISSGLPKVMMYRLLWDESAPLAHVRAADPATVEIRDYLVSVGKNDDIIYRKAYDHIRENILHIKVPHTLGEKICSLLGVSSWGNRQVDPYVFGLWRAYVATYPLAYLRFSLRELFTVLGMNNSYSHAEEFSRRVTSAHLDPRFRPVRSAWSVSDTDLEALDRIYYRTAGLMVSPPLVCLILALGLIDLLAAMGPGRVFRACVYVTMAYVTVPQFLVSIGILRYRYPFDLLYALVAGTVLERVWSSARSLRRTSSTSSPVRGPWPCAA